MSQADLVICQAGYNTIAEVESYGSRAIAVPAKRPFDDQFERAAQMARCNSSFCVLEERSADLLAESALKLLDAQVMPRKTQTSPDGAMLAAKALLEVLEHTSKVE